MVFLLLFLVLFTLPVTLTATPYPILPGPQCLSWICLQFACFLSLGTCSHSSAHSSSILVHGYSTFEEMEKMQRVGNILFIRGEESDQDSKRAETLIKIPLSKQYWALKAESDKTLSLPLWNKRLLYTVLILISIGKGESHCYSNNFFKHVKKRLFLRNFSIHGH